MTRKPRTKQQARDLIVTWVKAIAGVVGSVAVVAAAIVAFDSRYALAADINKQVEVNRLSTEISILQIRRSNLEDKVYDTAARQAQNKQRPLPPAEFASYQRYQAELNSVAEQIRAKEQQLERVRTGR